MLISMNDPLPRPEELMPHEIVARTITTSEPILITLSMPRREIASRARYQLDHGDHSSEANLRLVDLIHRCEHLGNDSGDMTTQELKLIASRLVRSAEEISECLSLIGSIMKRR